MKKNIFCTLGPSSMKEDVLKRLESLGVDLFRINMSHTAIKDLRNVIEFIRKYSNVPICIDSEGAQIRTGNLASDSYMLGEFAICNIKNKEIIGNDKEFCLNPVDAVNKLDLGDILTIDFNAVLAQVIDKNAEGVKIKIINGGKIGKNKALTVLRNLELNPFTQKDLEAFKIGADYGIKNYALSFANNENDVFSLRKLLPLDAKIISKIECREALRNLESITQASDAILIDRGDLSREEPLERIPFLQKQIIATGKKLNRPIYVATNLLESMIEAPLPTRAEVNDIYNTLLDGASGLVLAAETAIGKYPVKAVEFVKKVIYEFEQTSHIKTLDLENLISHTQLVSPHGGRLLQSFASEVDKKNISSMLKIEVTDNDLMDAEQISVGTFSPVSGFMTGNELKSVLDNYQYRGTTWTLPIVLQLAEDKCVGLSQGQEVALCNKSGEVYSILNVEEIYSPDLNVLAQKWFETTSLEHPGVKILFSKGKRFVAGKVKLVKRLPSVSREFELTPKETRLLFEGKRWSQVVGFHSRNVAHKVHEFIQKEALKITHADGLFISPVFGPKKSGDFHTDAIIESYKMMIENGHYPSGKVLLGGFSTYSRYAGPREAVFTALCRKNMGCSHFIIGRDHTGVGNFYAPDASQQLFRKLGDLGITPVFFDKIGFNSEKAIYDSSDSSLMISGTQVRDSIIKFEELPDWFIDKKVQLMLFDRLKHDRPVFIK